METGSPLTCLVTPTGFEAAWRFLKILDVMLDFIFSFPIFSPKQKDFDNKKLLTYGIKNFQFIK
ncbi:MAG: hypothetical protein IJ706_07205 [Clostridia bacterium]|nr:hypothetical protein [Clostridia bacterium]